MRTHIRIIIIAIFTIIIHIILMRLNVNNIINDVKKAFNNSDCYITNYQNDTINKNLEVNYIIYDESQYNQNVNIHFNVANDYPELNFSNMNVELKINKVFTLHNFRKGYIWFHYMLRTSDENHNQLSCYGTSGLYPVKMKIHNENGEWKIVQIWERL